MSAKRNKPKNASALSDFWSEYSKVKTGIVGLALLAIFLLTAALEPLVIPYKGAEQNWALLTFWQDNPRSAPPAWTNLFAAKKASTGLVGKMAKESGSADAETYSYSFDFQDDLPPQDIILHADIEVPESLVTGLKCSLTRPDGIKIDLATENSLVLNSGALRITVNNDCKEAVWERLKEESALYDTLTNYVSTSDPSILPARYCFYKADKDGFMGQVALKGRYTVMLSALPGVVRSAPSMVAVGAVSGILGTDSNKRDLYSGLVVGIKWALFIGIVTSVVTVLIGVFFGVISAYFGGWVDSAMQRVGEFFLLMPVLPFIIVLSALFKPSLVILMVIMIFFFWVGPVKPVRSIAMQIREETYIEASKAIGASPWRIIFKHIVPILLPFSFANMALSVPSVIIYESTISLLGLGDHNIVTWGRILQEAQNSSATLSGQWWWIIPPGIVMVLMGMSFAFIGTAMDKILHPKLRSR